jgi:hypothetical protein
MVLATLRSAPSTFDDSVFTDRVSTLSAYAAYSQVMQGPAFGSKEVSPRRHAAKAM